MNEYTKYTLIKSNELVVQATSWMYLKKILEARYKEYILHDSIHTTL